MSEWDEIRETDEKLFEEIQNKLQEIQRRLRARARYIRALGDIADETAGENHE